MGMGLIFNLMPILSVLQMNEVIPALRRAIVVAGTSSPVDQVYVKSHQNNKPMREHTHPTTARRAKKRVTGNWGGGGWRRCQVCLIKKGATE